MGCLSRLGTLLLQIQTFLDMHLRTQSKPRSYHPDIIHTNSNPQLNLGFVAFARQPPRSPSQRHARGSKADRCESRLVSAFGNAPLDFLPAFLHRCSAGGSSSVLPPAVPSSPVCRCWWWSCGGSRLSWLQPGDRPLLAMSSRAGASLRAKAPL